MEKIKVVIDPGHAPGNVNGGRQGYKEYSGMWKLSLYLKTELERRGVSVELTRKETEDPSLSERGRSASGSALFISEHSNASNGAARGVEVYYSVDLPGDKQIAAALSKAVSGIMGNMDRGAKTRSGTKDKSEDYYTVIDAAQDCGTPHVFLIENGFHDNASDEAFLLKDENLKIMAKTQADVICQHLNISQPNEEIIWNFLKGKGLNDFVIAGFLGNLFAESGLNPTNLQNSSENTLRMTDEEYTKAVDDGRYTDFINDKSGYGLAQWTFPTRKESLLKYAKDSGKSIGDLYMQLEYLWKELQGYSDMMNSLDRINTIRQASDIILINFERPADQSETVQLKRAEYAQKYYLRFAEHVHTVSPSAPSVSREYRITINTYALNIRKGPGTNTEIVKTLVHDKNIYTIIGESDGPGASKWLQLKSGIGWISKDFVKIV